MYKIAHSVVLIIYLSIAQYTTLSRQSFVINCAQFAPLDVGMETGLVNTDPFLPILQAITDNRYIFYELLTSIFSIIYDHLWWPKILWPRYIQLLFCDTIIDAGASRCYACRYSLDQEGECTFKQIIYIVLLYLKQLSSYNLLIYQSRRLCGKSIYFMIREWGSGKPSSFPTRKNDI